MPYNNTDILFASLVGSKVSLPRFNAVQNELMKHVLPPIPFLPLKNEIDIATADDDFETNSEKFEVGKTNFDVDLWKADVPTPEAQQFFPLTFIETKNNVEIRYLLPYEPMITITSKNIIVRRNVAKGNYEGTIKERWSRGDYEITITGVLIGSLLTGSVEDCFPKDDFQKLADILTRRKSWKINCVPLEQLGINNIVIEDFSFPFTKGENVQAYEIKCYSDFAYNLLLDITD